MENKININLSNEVSDIYNAKKHSFDPELIVPLKRELFRRAVEKNEAITPCCGDHFSVDKDELVFWYNSENESTKMEKIKIGS